ncbi:NADPH-dependent FMN reductase [Tropicimonas sp. IMCC34043]|uniref:NADPH-dependent FMN reductase n=1 Tax=Tropicimonas sp. IMCC34043 TaxID=2248760 RepID=UPI000E225411|nr:NAD(P)H-dependent oxidoreductase [Tropicimonas sp. IMCC34043]
MKLNVIITSTRPGRVGKPVADWFYDHAQKNGAGFEAVLTDLAEMALPLLDEPNHPAQKKYTKEHTKAWSAIVEASDAFVFVLPEYNFTMPPAFVNAVDYLYHEWAYKPAAFVSYGGISGGLRSTQTAKTLLTTLKVMPIPDQVIIPNVSNQLKDGVFTPGEMQVQSADTLLDELAKWAGALAGLRTAA